MMMFDLSHPEIIINEYIKDHNMTLVDLVLDLGTTRGYLSTLINGEQSITPEIAVKLVKTFTNTTSEFWIRLQSNYNLAPARKSKNSS